jgi:subtilisin family serine protease
MACSTRQLIGAGALLGLLTSLPAAGQGLAPATVNGPLTLAAPVRALKSPRAVYLVKLKQPGAATQRGGVPGFAATKPTPGSRFAAGSAAAQSYVRYLEDSHERLLERVGAGSAKLYSYRYALNGFAALLTAEQAGALAQRPEVARIWPDTDRRVQTNNSATFLGLENLHGGLRADLKLRGEGVVIGVIDSGIAVDHPSLRDYEERIPRACTSDWATVSWLGLFLCHSVRHNPPQVEVYDPPANFRGECQEGEGFAASDCNNKLVGARYYLEGFLARHELDPGEFLSPKDADGHGTHIATIAAGNSVTAEMFGTRVARVSGIAPRARIAVYKACWLQPADTRATCTTADLARAIDDAVADGVDIINYSVGSLETDLTAPDDLALLNAFDAGVLSVVAAGNDGPNSGTIGSPSSAPWVLTVAASTQKGTRFEEAINILEPSDLAGLVAMREAEASFTPQLRGHAPIEEDVALVDDGSDVLADGSPGSVRDACEPLSNASELAGRIALIERGGCEFQAKLARVAAAGAVAAIVYNTSGPPIEMRGDAGSVRIPAVMITSADGERLVDRLTGGETVRADLEKGLFLQQAENGNQMADFSSRGPALSEPAFVKPDLTAPGVDILAGHTPDVANGLKGELFQYLSGTSMSTPEVAGVAALLKEAHPEWSPATLKSALMTTAYQGVVASDGATPADAFEMGSGHVNADVAIDPGLIYDATTLDHQAYVCGLDNAAVNPADCALAATSNLPAAPRALNLPSLGIAALVSGDTVTRRVTNIGPPASYALQLAAPLGIDVSVTPSTLALGAGQSGEFTLTFARNGAPLDQWSFGRIGWTDGTHDVESPIVVRPVTLRAPAELKLEGGTGSARLPIAYGYSGDYRAAVHGLRAPLVLDGFVADDPTRTFTFRSGTGVTTHLLDMPPDQLYARFALFDKLTDGADDLDLYVFYCPGNSCVEVGESGGFTSQEEVDLVLPAAGLYAALVHGFATDQAVGGPGAHYSLLAWSFGIDDDVGNLTLTAPSTVAEGDQTELELSWGALAPATRYLGAISHNTPLGIYALTVIGVTTR